MYSYGSHFPIARHVETKRGRAVLFTTRDYSVTTSGHKWTVLRACQHLTVFHVQHPTDSDRKAQFAEYRERYLELARKYSRARSNKPWILAVFATWLTKQTISPSSSACALGSLCPTIYAAWLRSVRAIEKRERERKQREERKRQRETEERCRSGFRGKIDYCPNGYGQPIRLRIKGDELQTSRRTCPS